MYLKVFGDETQEFDDFIEMEWMPVVFQGYNIKPS